MTIHLVTAAIIVLMLLDAKQIRDALRHADISPTKAALWMGLDRAHLDRMLNGDGHLKHDALMRLPDRFKQWYAVLLIERYGLPAEIQSAAEIEQGLRGYRRITQPHKQDQRTA